MNLMKEARLGKTNMEIHSGGALDYRKRNTACFLVYIETGFKIMHLHICAYACIFTYVYHVTRMEIRREEEILREVGNRG